ncbi:MAG: hypothetical protein RBS99_14895 [Rhodospirillales bacterium]|jgi:hypothetical protein|nr:hypothetical protein [Rhodospirillales bacterium]
MPNLRTLKTSFTGGELSPVLLGRGDLAAYANGAARLRNVFIHPTGGVSRRPGLRHVETAPGDGRLVAFEFNTEQVHLLVFTEGRVDVYPDPAGGGHCHLDTPWTAAQIGRIAWTQSADTLLVLHPDVPPRRITRTAGGAWSVAEWAFFERDGRIFQPYHRFAPEAATLAPSAISGAVTLSASEAVFAPGHAGTRLRIGGREVEITAVVSTTQAEAATKEPLASTEPTREWEEQAFSAVRGWPTSATFHQDRLVIGGSRDLPNRLWLSKSGDLFNFDLGEGLDDEAIEFAILSDQVNAVRAVFSGRHLQVFTSGAEWMVAGDPLTPGNIQLNRQTRVGSPVDRTVPPRDVDGATLFVSRGLDDLREFVFADIEQAYQAADLSMLARHVVKAPRDQDFDKARRLLHVVMEDGTMATVTLYRAEKVTAWTVQETQGAFRSVAVAGGETFVLVERGGAFFVEAFDAALAIDAGMVGRDAEPRDRWSGLAHLEGRTVKVVADGAVRADAEVTGGAVTLDAPARAVQAGLGFAHVIEPLPPAPAEAAGGGQGGRVRLIEATFRLLDTAALRLDTGRGFTEVPFRRFGPDTLDSPPPAFTGDRTVRAFGWRRGGTAPLWRIAQDTPLPFTLLSVASLIGADV